MRLVRLTIIPLAVVLAGPAVAALPHSLALTVYGGGGDIRACRFGTPVRAAGYAARSIPLPVRPPHALTEDFVLSAGRAATSQPVREGPYYDWRWVFAGAVALITLLAFSVYWWRLDRRVRSRLQLLRRPRRRERDEAVLRRSESALRALHGIGSSHAWGFEEKVQELLAFGCKQFSLPVGIVSNIVGGTYEVLAVLSPDGAVVKGSVFPLGHTYCNLTLKSSEPVCFEHAAACEWGSHPAYLRHKLEAYLGIRVVVDGVPYGTLSFIGPEPRAERFTETDKEILKLMADWLGSALARERAEAQMRKLSGALEQTADAVMIFSRDGEIEYVNPAFEKVRGVPSTRAYQDADQMRGLIWEGENDYRRMWETVLNGEVFRDISIGRRADGSCYYEEKTVTPLKNAQGIATHFISTGKDVTERIQAEERERQNQAQLVHAQRASATSAMATSLAHELNQPLAAIVNYAQGCILRIRDGSASAEELLPALQHIVSEGARSGEIIRRVRRFLRNGESLRGSVDINGLAHAAVELTGAQARQKSVVLKLELEKDLPPVIVDAVQIEQVIVNLVNNAIDAIGSAECSRREVVIQTVPRPNNGVEVRVCDTGPGFGSGEQERIFESFFTTKRQGMGMGLSISRSIVEAHGEHLWACSNENGGATLRFGLPTASKGGEQ